MIYPGIVLNNRYQVIKQIGGGGFGQIFAVDDGGICKVLKVLNLQRFQDTTVRTKVLALFEREAKILSQMKHPGIPRVEPENYFHWAEDGNQSVYCLVMEKITGLNLQQWLCARNNQPITTQEAFNWLTQLAQILAQLHQQQYFHRDIKPSNIMLKPDGQLVLVDFGAVREVTQSYLQQQKGNETGTVIISAGYTPPEQAEGHAVMQSDFFALGRTFVYLLTGKSPLDFPKNPQTGELRWREKATEVYSPLADLIDQMMAPFPGGRPQNSQELLNHLTILERKFRSPWHQLIKKYTWVRSVVDQKTKLTKTIRRNPRLQWSLASIVFLFSSGLWIFSANRANIADALNLQGLENYRQERWQLAEFYYRLALVFDPQMEGVQYNLGSVYEEKQAWDKARAAYQVELQRGFDKAYNNLARLEILDKNYTAALPLLQKGLSLTKDDKVKYNLLKNLGWAQLELGEYSQAQTSLQKAIYLDKNRASAYCLQAQVWENLERSKAALLAWENCLKFADPDSLDEQRWIEISPLSLKKSTRM